MRSPGSDAVEGRLFGFFLLRLKRTLKLLPLRNVMLPSPFLSTHSRGQTPQAFTDKTQVNKYHVEFLRRDLQYFVAAVHAGMQLQNANLCCVFALSDSSHDCDAKLQLFTQKSDDAQVTCSRCVRYASCTLFCRSKMIVSDN